MRVLGHHGKAAEYIVFLFAVYGLECMLCCVCLCLLHFPSQCEGVGERVHNRVCVCRRATSFVCGLPEIYIHYVRRTNWPPSFYT